MSVHLKWMVVWNNCSVLIKKNKQTYSPETNALKVCNSVHYNGLIYCKTVGVEPAANVKGFVGVMKCRSGQQKPFTSYVSEYTRYPQQHQAHDLKEHVLPRSVYGSQATWRASDILEGQKPVVVKWKWTHPNKSSWTLYPRSDKRSAEFFSKIKKRNEIKNNYLIDLERFFSRQDH